MTGLPLTQFAGIAALLAAAATVIGAVTLLRFFQVGGRWGLWNDVASIVLMLAMIPVALLVAAIESERFPTIALVIAGIGIVGMAIAAAAQARLVAGAWTYEQNKPWTLGGGAIVGVWYVLAGLLAFGTVIGGALPYLAIAAGLGSVAVGYGFLVGNERHPLSAIGGTVLFIASLGFLAVLGVGLLNGAIAVPVWNQ